MSCKSLALTSQTPRNFQEFVETIRADLAQVFVMEDLRPPSADTPVFRRFLDRYPLHALALDTLNVKQDLPYYASK
jgi:hypothetical protein